MASSSDTVASAVTARIDDAGQDNGEPGATGPGALDIPETVTLDDPEQLADRCVDCRYR